MGAAPPPQQQAYQPPPQQPAYPPPPQQNYAPPPPGYQAQPGYPPQGYPPQGYAPASSGLQENVACALCYALGFITGILFLVLEPLGLVGMNSIAIYCMSMTLKGWT